MRTAGMAGNGQNVGGEDSSASDARVRTVPEYGGYRGPDQCARHGMDPAQRARDRVAAPAVDREHRELVDRERTEHDQRLLQRRLGPDALVLAHGNIGYQRKRQGVLTQDRSLEDIEREAREEAEADPAQARGVHRPV